MTDLDALLKRSFAEIEEPADDGFSARVAHAVGRKESALKLGEAVRLAVGALAIAALAYGVYVVAIALGLESLLSLAGDGIGNARGALSSAPSAGDLAASVTQSLGAGMTQFLLVGAALADSATAYRASQD